MYGRRAGVEGEHGCAVDVRADWFCFAKLSVRLPNDDSLDFFACLEMRNLLVVSLSVGLPFRRWRPFYAVFTSTFQR